MKSLILHFKSILTKSGWKENISLEIDQNTGKILSEYENHPAFSEQTAHAIGVSGLNNLHSHAFQRGFAGLSQRPSGVSAKDSFWTWRETLYKFLQVLTPETLEVIAAQAYMEMLETGFTGVAEFHYLHHDRDGKPYDNPAEMSERIFAAAQETGLFVTLLPVYYRQSGFNERPPEPYQAPFIHKLENFIDLQERLSHRVKEFPSAQLGLALHSLRAVKPEDLQFLAKAAEDHPVHIHISEQMAEVNECISATGQRPVAWVFDHIEVDKRWCFIHATHIDEYEKNLLSSSGAVVGLCPLTEADLGDGLFPAKAFMSEGGIFGIGSDSNCKIEALEELRLLEYGQRLFQQKRNVLAQGKASTGRSLFVAATQGGNQALQRNSGIETGKYADIVSLNPEHPDLVGKKEDALLDSWIFSGGKSCIDRVWVGGIEKVVDGKHLKRDRIQKRYVTLMKKLLESL